MKSNKNCPKMRIVVGGPPYGEKNIGDEAILDSILHSISTITLNVKIIIITNEYKNSGQYPFEIEIVPLYSFKQIQLELFYCDLLICGGATILSDCTERTIFFLKYAKLFHKPTMVYGVGMDPIKNIKLQNELVKLLKTVEVITVRDPSVFNRLLKIENFNNLYLAADPVFNINFEEKKNEKDVFHEKRSKKLVGFVISREEGYSNLINYEYIEIILNFLIENDYKVIFIPTNQRENGDILNFKLLQNKFQNLGDFDVLIESNYKLLINKLKVFDFIISSRLHLMIFSALSGVPFIGILRGEKTRWFLDYYGFYHINFELTKELEILPNIEEFIDTIIEKKRIVLERTYDLINKSKVNCEQLEKLIDLIQINKPNFIILNLKKILYISGKKIIKFFNILNNQRFE